MQFVCIFYAELCMLSMELYVGVGSRIKEERLRLKMTQTQLAQASGASLRSVASWEANEARPTSSTLTKLAQAGIDIGYIVNGRRVGNAHRVLAGAGLMVDNSGQLLRANEDHITQAFAANGSPEFEYFAVSLEQEGLPLSTLSIGRAMAMMDRYGVPAEAMMELILFVMADQAEASANRKS